LSIKCVLFDLGETLVTREIEDRAIDMVALDRLATFADRSGYRIDRESLIPLFLENYRRLDELRDTFFVEIPMRCWLGNLLSHVSSGRVNERLLGRAMEIFVEARSSGVVCFPEVPNILNLLKSKYRLGIVTNTSSSEVPNRVLSELKLRGYFSVLATSAELGVRKPYPGIFYYALRELSARAEDTAFVGDSIKHDIIGAKSLGMKTFLVDRRQRYNRKTMKADLTLRSLSGLPKVLASL
jgi:putative hydrolase of the HAD superfamily